MMDDRPEDDPSIRANNRSGIIEQVVILLCVGLLIVGSLVSMATGGYATEVFNLFRASILLVSLIMAVMAFRRKSITVLAWLVVALVMAVSMATMPLNP